MNNNIGSTWNRWDLHIHTPGTGLNDQFHCSMDDFIKKINDSDKNVIALGITDYYSVENFKTIYSSWNAGNLPQIKLLIPNVELRLSIPTKDLSAINIHVLFSSCDSDFINRIESALNRLTFSYQNSQYNCNKSDITRLGNAIDQTLESDAQRYLKGLENFKIDFTILEKWYTEDAWLQKNAIIAVSAKTTDGTSTLAANGGFKGVRQNIQKLAGIIFSGCESDIKYWLGQGADSKEKIIEDYGNLKPCIIGCDAHTLDKVLKPDNDRFCWIKAEPTFEGLKQILYEPENRVYIGNTKPDLHRENCFTEISLNSDWFKNKKISLNKGLVSIIGARGSGKTALLDFIAYSAGSYEQYDASFLFKAQSKLKQLEITLINSENQSRTCAYKDLPNFDAPQARYLSQQFVELLCSNSGSSRKLLEAIEGFIFDNIPEVERCGTTNFTELRDYLCSAFDEQIVNLQTKITQCNYEITKVYNLKQTVEQKKADLANVISKISTLEQKLPNIDEKEKTQNQKQYDIYLHNKNEIVNTLKPVKTKIEELRKLHQEFCVFIDDVNIKIDYFKNSFRNSNLPNAILDQFVFTSPNNLHDAINTHINTLLNDFNIKLGSKENPAEHTFWWYENQLVEIQQKSTNLSDLEKFYFNQLELIQAEKNRQTELENQIKEITALDYQHLQTLRIECYMQVISNYYTKKRTLEALYAPLVSNIKLDKEKSKLGFFVKPRINIEKWVKQGEDLIDLRKAQQFNDHKKFVELAENKLYQNLYQLNAEAAKQDIKNFFESDVKNLKEYLLESKTLVDLANWIFSTDHISIEYEITFEGVPIEQLSPGTKGVVLMLLFLGVDIKDSRPLLIDQPEDNLDPESVYTILVPFFIEAKKRRQIIMVTHNPNLVVATDSDQVIVASANKINPNELPQLSYISGGLEDPAIVQKVCSILEGGKRAFKQRGSRYKNTE